ncbi:hypothetical protein SPRG_11889 [Saprolegnia parasitica CBS 223.65]|uniref:Ankyrin repeat protein n=1 Tax=Saprolegnia parasitica (strain CBS 223.65) TaxID=695850 RepID=A0A067C897_SAPPC|nr:hypothetical protein SPRG_11889 [Saprolegnia parasitica CBS 223.65]KDO23042.1 hypothetical protein SPRG_11889 [Saprolegnia parasitica CBS 223.65]|eukprot:XP_012206329.1 hypothetical protein SPRG_11889 [Saprolegnia parasitica CBS 223.65]
MNAAAEHGHIAIVRFLHDHRREICTVDAMDAAAKHGDLLGILHYHRHEGCTSLALNAASTTKHQNIVDFLHTHREKGGATQPCAATSTSSASLIATDAKAVGRSVVAYVLPLIETLRVLPAANAPCTQRVLTWAAMAGHVHVVAFLRQNRNEGDANEALATALRMGMDRVAVRLQAASAAVVGH